MYEKNSNLNQPSKPFTCQDNQRSSQRPISYVSRDRTIRQYVRNMSTIPLPSHQRELQLAYKIEEGLLDTLEAIARSGLSPSFLRGTMESLSTSEIRSMLWHLHDLDRSPGCDGPEAAEIVHQLRHQRQLLDPLIQSIRQAHAMLISLENESMADSCGCEDKKRQFVESRRSLAATVGLTPISLARVGRRIERAERRREKAKAELVERNLRLVVYFARRIQPCNIPLLDLVQEGNIGLMHAADKFEPRLDYRFSTYASYWIRQYMSRAIDNQSQTIRIPIGRNEKIRRIRRVTQQFVQSHGRLPSIEETAHEAGIEVDKVSELCFQNLSTVSLDKPVGLEQDCCLADFIADENAEDPQKHTIDVILSEEVHQALEKLNPREQTVLRMRFGLDDGREHTLEQIGRQFNVTRERIRQIEVAALEKLRKADRNNRFKSFIEKD